MASTQAQPNIWAQMSYTPPRGSCSQKTSMVTSCSCHRFMIHPLKAASSYDCDGCGHHASFHRLSNPEEEAIISRWKNTGGITQSPHRDSGLEESIDDYVARVLAPNRRYLEVKPTDSESSVDTLLENYAPGLDRSKRRRLEAEPKEKGRKIVDLLEEAGEEDFLATNVAKTRKRKGRGGT